MSASSDTHDATFAVPSAASAEGAPAEDASAEDAASTRPSKDPASSLSASSEASAQDTSSPPARDAVSFGRQLQDLAVAAAPAAIGSAIFAVPSCCPVLLPAFLLLLGTAYAQGVGIGDRSSRVAIGLVGAPLVLLPMVSAFLAGSLVHAPLARSLLALALSMASLAAVAPFLATPFVWLERRDGLFDSLFASAAEAADRGLGPTLALGAQVGLVGVVPWLLVPLAFEVGPWGLVPTFVSLPVAFLVAMTQVARSFYGTSARFGHHRSVPRPRAVTPSAARSSQRLATAGALGLAPLALVLVTLLLVLANPARPWQPARGPYADDHLLATGESLEIPGSRGVTITRVDALTFDVTTVDGGGAGRIHFASSMRSYVTGYGGGVALVDEPSGAVARIHDEGCVVPIDARGLRLDDSPTHRLAAYFGGVVGLVLAIALALLSLALAALVLRTMGVTASLVAPSAESASVLIEGRLTTTKPIAIAEAHLVVTDTAHLDAVVRESPLRLAIPPGRYPLIAFDGVTPRAADGAVLSALVPRPLLGATFRSELPTVPTATRFGLGRVDAVLAAYVDRTVRVIGMLAVPVTALAFGLTLLALVNG